MKHLLLVGALIFSFSVLSQQQNQEVVQSFRPVFIGGVLGAQIDGDTYSGYKKPGYYFGVGINRQISKRVELEFDIIALQKGVRFNYKTDSASLNDPNNHFSLIRLNYVEIPLSIRFSYKKFRWEVGSYFSYLVKNPPYNRSEIGFIDDPNYKNVDYGWLVGGGFKIRPNVLINLRWEYSYVPIRDYYPSTTGIYHGQFPRNLFNMGLYNNVVSVSLQYKLPPRATAKTDAQ
ncbi:MAG: outer membrane beta-barrel protein [Bacteroidia bacterium]